MMIDDPCQASASQIALSYCVVSIHNNLSDMDIFAGSGNYTQILLVDALTLSSELTDGTEGGEFEV